MPDRSHDPFAPLTVREPAPSFPEDRLRRAGSTEQELAESREAWDSWSADEQRIALDALARLTDEELAEQVADREGVTEEPEALQPNGSLTGVVGPADNDGPCLICESLDPAVVATLPEHDRRAHVGDEHAGQILDRPVEFIEGNPAPEHEPGSMEWWNAAGYEVLAGHSSPADESAPGGPGATAEAPSAANADGAAPSTEPAAGVPDGTVEQVLAWVGDDDERAKAALAAEEAGKGRKGITDPLGKRLAAPAADG